MEYHATNKIHQYQRAKAIGLSWVATQRGSFPANGPKGDDDYDNVGFQLATCSLRYVHLLN